MLSVRARSFEVVRHRSLSATLRLLGWLPVGSGRCYRAAGWTVLGLGSALLVKGKDRYSAYQVIDVIDPGWRHRTLPVNKG